MEDPIKVIIYSGSYLRPATQGKTMKKNNNYLMIATITGWLIVTFSAPAIISGIFIVLGTAQPWGLVVPFLFLTFGWALTRLDFHEVYWKETLGIFIVIWGIVGIFTTLLIISRTNSLLLTFGVLPVLYCIGIGGLVLSQARVRSRPV